MGSTSVDHGEAQAAGGKNDESNWFTTSALHNFEKGDRTLAQLGWHLFPKGDWQKWDGMLAWFFEYVNDHPDVLKVAFVKKWHSAASEAALLASELSPHISASKDDVVEIMQLASSMGIVCERGFEAANSKDVTDLIELAMFQSATVALIVGLLREFLKSRRRSILYVQEGVGWLEIQNPKDSDIKKVLSVTDSFRIKNTPKE